MLKVNLPVPILNRDDHYVVSKTCTRKNRALLPLSCGHTVVVPTSRRKYALVKSNEIIEGNWLDYWSVEIKRPETEIELKNDDFCPWIQSWLYAQDILYASADLPKFSPKPDLTRALSPSDCAICLGRIEKGNLTHVLACGHCFHRKCSNKWLRTFKLKGCKPTCPLCRA